GLGEQLWRAVGVEVAEIVGPRQPRDRRTVYQVTAEQQLRPRLASLGEGAEPGHDRAEVSQVAVQVGSGDQGALRRQGEPSPHPPTMSSTAAVVQPPPSFKPSFKTVIQTGRSAGGWWRRREAVSARSR